MQFKQTHSSEKENYLPFKVARLPKKIFFLVMFFSPISTLGCIIMFLLFLSGICDDTV